MTHKWTIKKFHNSQGRPWLRSWHAIPPHAPIPPRNITIRELGAIYIIPGSMPTRSHVEALAYVNEQIREAADGSHD